MSNITVYIREDLERKGMSPIYLRVFIAGKYVKVALDVWVEVVDWDKEKEQLRAGKDRKKINLIINNAKGRAADIFLRYTMQRRSITRELFRKEFVNPTNETDFFLFWESEIKRRENEGEIETATAIQHRTQLNKLKQFRVDITFADVTADLLGDYKVHLRKLGNEKNTIHNSLKTLKTYIRIAIRKKIMWHNPFDDVVLQKQRTYPKFVEPEELELLWKLYDSGILANQPISMVYHRTLRYFLAVCNCGLRISDFMALTMDNLITRNKKKYITFDIMKTDTEGLMPVNDKLLRLIGDENGLRKVNQSVLMFQCDSQPKMNVHIKEVARMAKLPQWKCEKISFNWGRHTFGSLLICKGVDVLTVSKLMGHSNANTTLSYYAHLIPGNKESAVDML